jgi:HEAT repeat protein
MPSPTADPLNFDALCTDIEVEISQGNWGAVSDRLKGWSSEFRGTLGESIDRQRLTEFGLALLQSGDVADCRGLAPVFRPACPEAIAQLHAMLIDPAIGFESRWFAGQILAKLNQFDAMAVLVATLESPDEMTASIAIDTLSHFGRAEIELLAGELARSPRSDPQTQDPEIRRRCIVRALAQISDPLVIAPLLSVVRDTDPAIRLLAIAALSAFDDDRVLPPLLDALRDTSAPVRKAALTSLGAKAQYQQRFQSSPPHASNPRLDWLTYFQPLTLDLNLEVATQAVIAIGRLRSEAAIDVLIALLNSPLTPTPQAIATVHALRQHANPRTLTALLDACALPSSPHAQSITLEIIRGLGRLHESAVVLDAATLLVQWCERYLGGLSDRSLSDQDPDILQAIAYSLGNLGQPVGRFWLDRLSSDPRDRVRITANAALQKLDVTPSMDE